jgi:hypothetical protein
MTRFPLQANDTNAKKADQELWDAIHTVEEAIRISPGGRIPKLADSRNPHYHPLLRDDVEVYLPGCSRGIAIGARMGMDASDGSRRSVPSGGIFSTPEGGLSGVSPGDFRLGEAQRDDAAGR